MFDSSDLALPLSERVRATGRPARVVDVSAVHYFWFGRRLWLSGLGLCVQASLLLVSGVFLLTQMSSTPNLVVQIALTGALLTLCGIAMLWRAASDFMAGLRIDRKGVRVHLGWTRFFVPWQNIERWSVNQPRIPELPAVTLWLNNKKQPVVVTGAQADESVRHEIQEVLRAFAYGKEAD
jgi:hypothetical protein